LTAEQFQRIGDPRGAPGEHHDAVGGAGRLGLGAAQLGEKTDEANRGADKGDRQRQNHQRAEQASARGGGHFVRIVCGL
jgi:hypothetical protein